MKQTSILALALLVSACGYSPDKSGAATLAEHRAGVVLDRFQLIGLPVGAARVLSDAEFPAFLETPREAVEFAIPLCRGCRGRIFVFASVSTMERAMAHLQATPSLADAAFSWLFPYGQVLVQLDGRVPQEWATRYQDALQSLALSTN